MNGTHRRQMPTTIFCTKHQEKNPVRPFGLTVVGNLQHHCCFTLLLVHEVRLLMLHTSDIQIALQDWFTVSFSELYLFALFTEAERYFSSWPPVHWFLAWPPPHEKINFSSSQNNLLVDKLRWHKHKKGRSINCIKRKTKSYLPFHVSTHIGKTKSHFIFEYHVQASLQTHTVTSSLKQRMKIRLMQTSLPALGKGTKTFSVWSLKFLKSRSIFSAAACGCMLTEGKKQHIHMHKCKFGTNTAGPMNKIYMHKFRSEFESRWMIWS